MQTIHKTGPSNLLFVINSMQELMKLAIEDALNPYMVSLAGWMCQLYSCDPRSAFSTSSAIHYWVKTHIRYQRDPSPAEYIQAPQIVLKNRAGDCDCSTGLQGALNMAIGNTIRFVLIRLINPENKQIFFHIYLQVYDPKKGWISYDATDPRFKAGWEPPTHAGKWIIEQNNEAFFVEGFFSDIGDFFQDAFDLLRSPLKTYEERKKMIQDQKREMKKKMLLMTELEKNKLYFDMGKVQALKQIESMQKSIKSTMDQQRDANSLIISTIRQRESEKNNAELGQLVFFLQSQFEIYLAHKINELKKAKGIPINGS